MDGPRKPPTTFDDLTFRRQGMTAWFDPRQLASTGLHTLLSSIFGAYADKREVQAALDPPPFQPPVKYDLENDQFWFDFVADLGDGFDSTFTVASLLARERLEVPTSNASGAASVPTRRGGLMVMGGDQVYPVATREQYRNRLTGPYEAAMPWCDPSRAPDLYAIPGNHDWYDGLTSFYRLFCQRRWIGGWKTVQSRSYFAAQLPAGWWLWGVDMQLTADFDEPQLHYFERMADRIAAGERLIICTPSPNWVKAGMGDAKAFEMLDFFLKRVVPDRAEVALFVSGDLHHYARYEGATGRHYVTAGGGGAFLYPTHNLPPAFTIEHTPPASSSTSSEALTLESVYPSAAQSKVLALRVIAFVRHNGWFAALLGAIYVVFGWILQSASNGTLVATLANATSAGAALSAIAHSALRGPSAVVFAGVVLFGLIAFASGDWVERWRTRLWPLVGALHGVAHLALGCTILWMLARLVPLDLSRLAHLVVFVGLMFVTGAVLGGMLMGVYLLLSNVMLKMHDDEVFSSQGIADYKQFLRFKLTPNGELTIHCVAIDHVTTDWKANPQARPGEPWIVPTSGALATCYLAEPPVRVAPSGVVAGPMPTAAPGTVARR
jgi:hypothetical protein